MQVLVNGKATNVQNGATISTLLGGLGLQPENVAVECNRQIVPRARYGETALADGDALEVVTFVGGG